MAKSSSVFVCQECGATHPKWGGRCEACGAWNTIIEEVTSEAARPGGLGKGRGKKIEFVGLASTDRARPPRLPTGLAEFDRVAGGGLVPGSAILVGGDPGIGKSTLLLQPTTARRGVPKEVGAVRAWISTSMGRVPSIPAKNEAPDTAWSRSARNSAEGLVTCDRPASVISKTPISSAGPKRFLTARRIRN